MLFIVELENNLST